MASQTTTTLKLDEKTKARLRRLGEARRRSAHWLMCDAIGQYLDREEARQKLNRDTLAAWEEYNRTGLHVTGEEMDAWMKRLEQGENPPPPRPHR
jgi:predicted transcriptional regulator